MTSQYKNYKLFIEIDLKLPHGESEMSWFEDFEGSLKRMASKMTYSAVGRNGSCFGRLEFVHLSPEFGPKQIAHYYFASDLAAINYERGMAGEYLRHLKLLGMKASQQEMEQKLYGDKNPFSMRNPLEIYVNYEEEK